MIEIKSRIDTSLYRPPSVTGSVIISNRLSYDWNAYYRSALAQRRKENAQNIELRKNVNKTLDLTKRLAKVRNDLTPTAEATSKLYDGFSKGMLERQDQT
jgi:hypothetical protein